MFPYFAITIYISIELMVFDESRGVCSALVKVKDNFANRINVCSLHIYENTCIESTANTSLI